MNLQVYHELRRMGEMIWHGKTAREIHQATGLQLATIRRRLDRLTRIREMVKAMPKPLPYTTEQHYITEFEVYDCDDYNAHFLGAEDEDDRQPEDWGKEWPLPLIY